MNVGPKKFDTPPRNFWNVRPWLRHILLISVDIVFTSFQCQLKTSQSFLKNYAGFQTKKHKTCNLIQTNSVKLPGSRPMKRYF